MAKDLYKRSASRYSIYVIISHIKERIRTEQLSRRRDGTWEELKLVGYSIVENLNDVLESRIVGKLREGLDGRRREIEHGADSGIYLIQIYPQDVHLDAGCPVSARDRN